MVKIGDLKNKFPENMENKAEFNKYIASFAIATLLLTIGIIVGNYLSEEKMSKIKEIENNIQFDIMSMEIQDLLFTENPCNSISIQLEERLKETATKISFMENQLGKTEGRVINLKKEYSLLEIKHYIIMKTKKDKCNLNYSTILFFYSNQKEKIYDSERQGYVLDNIRQKYKVENVKVYSLDKDLDLYIIGELAKFYGVWDVPAIVVNNQTLMGFQSKEKVNKILNITE
ncbi:MAG: hypothetical protein V1660_00980 [archaeon]